MNLHAMNESKLSVENEPEHEGSALAEQLILFPPRKNQDLEMKVRARAPSAACSEVHCTTARMQEL